MSDQVQLNQEEHDPYEELENQVKQDFEELTVNGKLVDSFVFGGHSFAIRTLNSSEEWAASKAMLPFSGSLHEPQAYMAAIVGLALVSYDGDPDFHRRIDDVLTHAVKRLEWVGQLDTIFIEELFKHYNALDQRRNTALREAINLSEPSRQAFMPFADSGIEWGSSGLQTPGENLP
jgi:hypothetical protein